LGFWREEIKYFFLLIPGGDEQATVSILRSKVADIKPVQVANSHGLPVDGDPCGGPRPGRHVQSGPGGPGLGVRTLPCWPSLRPRLV
jgi:hypothetical protein